MTQTADIEVSRGNAKLASGVFLFLGILLFLNYGVARLSDLFAYPMWPSHVDKAVVIGDGGGIALIVGMSRLFPFPKYVLLECLAITPIPLLFLLRALQQRPSGDRELFENQNQPIKNAPPPLTGEEGAYP